MTIKLPHTSVRLAFLIAALSTLSCAPLLADDSAIEQKVEALLSKMTLEEKAGQMTQADMGAVKDKMDIAKYAFGSMLSGGDSDPADNQPGTWRKSCASFQDYALKSRLKIPLIYGVDAVHGHNNVLGAVIFPHDIGLGATHNAKIVEEAEYVTAQEIAGTSIEWAFGPCVAVAQNIRWGRTYESFSDSPTLAAELGAAAVRGFQRPLPNGARVLACAKHFMGDGGTQDGVDQGNMVCDEETARKLHLAPYKAAVAAGVGSIMVSYSSWNGAKMHGNKHLLTDVLKGELGFKGFLVSDYAAIDQLAPDYRVAIEKAINAGVDMGMIPNGPGQRNNYVQFIEGIKSLVAEGKIPQSRVDDAVRRILRTKFEFGVFEHPYVAPELEAAIGSPAHRAVARDCVRQSLVLLKNENHALPLSKSLKKLAVIGAAADDLGTQCGGWTITWQGAKGQPIPGGTSILAAIRKVLPGADQVVFSKDGSDISGLDAAVVVIGEQPYAEMKGDRKDLRISAADTDLVKKVKSAGLPVVTLLISGRPLIPGAALEASDAFVAAWLPGSEGDGVADVLFGDYKPTGKLPRVWPASNEQLQSSSGEPLFPLGFGLTF